MIDIFETNTFKIEVTSDIFSTELCGALKNIVALGAGKNNNFVYKIIYSIFFKLYDNYVLNATWQGFVTV